MTTETRILLVDDQPSNLQIASAVLNEEGYKIMVAKSGARALELASAHHPDLILLDVMMPGMDGYETCTRLQADPETMDIPVLFLTAKTDDADIERGFSVGSVDYIGKPFRPRELKARVRTHLALRRALAQQERLNEVKSRFLAMAAHDLKNPLHCIVGYVEMLIMDLESGASLTMEDEQTVNMLRRIDAAATTMSTLVHEVLESGTLEAGSVELNPEQCDLDEIIQNVLEMNRLQAQRKNIEIESESVPGCIAMVDRRSIQEAFDNLVNNALKYSPENSRVELRLLLDTPRQGMVRFEVKDQGLGMDENDLKLVFARYQRLSAKPTGGESSTGLGLSIAKELVEQQNGTIDVTSPGKGKGCTFCVDLPMANPAMSSTNS